MIERLEQNGHTAECNHIQQERERARLAYLQR
jgi:hypothetical protein